MIAQYKGMDASTLEAEYNLEELKIRTPIIAMEQDENIDIKEV